MKRIEDYMTEFPVTVTESTTVAAALDLFKSCGFRHLPVLRSGQVTGIVSERDLRQAEILADAMTLVVSDFMTARPYCVRTGVEVLQVVREMRQHKYGAAVITTPAGKVVGIFTTIDALELLARLLDDHSTGPFSGLTVDQYLSHGSLATA